MSTGRDEFKSGKSLLRRIFVLKVKEVGGSGPNRRLEKFTLICILQETYYFHHIKEVHMTGVCCTHGRCKKCV